MNLRIVLFFLLIGLLINACGENAFHKESKTFTNGYWTYQDVVHFNFEIQDTSMAHSLYLNFMHNSDFPYQNLYYKITTTLPNEASTSQTLSTDFADKMGRWQGDCQGNDCELKVILQENARFKYAGNYSLTLEQFTRTDSLEGIQAVELNIE